MRRFQIREGDAVAKLAELDAVSVQTCVTSPPYFGLRDYGVSGQIGLEKTPEAFVAALVGVFRGVHRVLRNDGIVFLNLGDSYWGSGRGPTGHNGIGDQARRQGFESANALRVQACGNGGKAELDYQGNGSSFESHGDERTDVWWSCIVDSDVRLALAQSRESCLQIQGCMGALRDRLPIVDSLNPQPTQQSLVAIVDRVRSALPAVERLHALLASKPDEYALLQPENSRPLDMLSAFLSSLRSLVACVLRCVHTLDASAKPLYDKAGIASLFAELADHIRCTDGCCSLLVSWLNYSKPERSVGGNLKPKDLIGIPWMVAFALRADGWYLRSDIIWNKPNPMPESVEDRPTKSHEYIFLLSKSAQYFYDGDAIKEPSAGEYLSTGVRNPRHGNPLGKMPSELKGKAGGQPQKRASGYQQYTAFNSETDYNAGRNRRSVWTVTTNPYAEAHFATFPPKLIEPCILAGSKEGDTVLDPFAGAGTTGLVALRHNRHFIGIELNPTYCEMARRRVLNDAPLFNEQVA